MPAAWEAHGRLLVGSGGDADLEEARAALLDSVAGDGAFARIARYAELGAVDVVALALVAAVELDEETSTLLGSQLTVGMVRGMLGDAGAAALADDAPLGRAALVEVAASGPLGTAAVRLARRAAWALLGDTSLDPDLPVDAEAFLAEDPGGAPRVLASGPDRVRRVEAAAAATSGPGFLVTPPPAHEIGWRAVVAQATVAGVGLVIELPSPTPEAPDAVPAGVRRWVERATHLPIALCSADPLPLHALPRHGWNEVEPAPAAVTDEEWKTAFAGAAPPARRPSADQLRAVGRLDDVAPGPAVRRLASGSIMRHARRVVPRATWDDLVLPASHRRRLRSLVDRYRHREQVHEEWKLPLFPSPGVVALFTGPSGTGKTTSAEVLAHDLGVDMFRVDLSALVSKYIGETEKNLEEVFSAANAGDYLLLFDEADSLFGQRSAVTDSKDRYANMEVSYLLQRLETYDGFVVLTSNFQGNIDDAFLRRIHAAVSFPVPSAEDRERIWALSLADAPRAGVELDHLARFELSGGSIRNAALSAAFLAAAADREVGMPELLAGVSDELTKLRQRVSPQQFGRWADQVAALL